MLHGTMGWPLAVCLALMPVAMAGQAAQGQADKKEELRGVVIVARHGARAPIESETRSEVFNAQPWPKWPVEPGLLTPHGITALQRMGGYYKQRYGGLITSCHSVLGYSTKSPRAFESAGVVMRVLEPQCDAHNIGMSLTTDPPGLDKAKLEEAVEGRMGDDPVWFTQTYARPLELMHDVLTMCDGCKDVPDFRSTRIDASQPAVAQGMMQAGASSAQPKVAARDPRKENAVALGADFAENLLLEYVEGLPMHDVGWGRVDRAKLDELMEMNTRYHDFMLRTPYWSKAAAGPLAEKIVSLLQMEAEGKAAARLAYLSAHDANLGWLGGLLRLDWKVSDEAQNATPPGSAMVFELWRDAKTNADTVRVMFVAQTLDQMRNLTPLTPVVFDPNAGAHAGAEKPSISPIYVPGCSGPGPEYACTLKDFTRVVEEAAR